MSGYEDERIKNELYSIEPASGAKERMLANIRKKAAMTEAAGNEETASATTPMETLKPEATKKGAAAKSAETEVPKKRRAVRTWMWLVPTMTAVAAAVVILLVVGPFAKEKKNVTAPVGTDAPGITSDGETEITGVVSGGQTDVSGVIAGGPITECGSKEEMEKLLKFSVHVPEEAEDPRFFIEDGRVGVVEYKVEEKEYTLYAAQSEELLEYRKTGRPATTWDEDGVFYMRVG